MKARKKPKAQKTAKTAEAIKSPAVPSADADQLAVSALVAVLEKRIYSGQLVSGCVLPAERELSEEFRVSRTVAREAVKILGGKGLINMRPRHRPVVLQPGYDLVVNVMDSLVRHLIDQPEGTENLFALRIFVEAALVRLAATDARKENIAALREALNNNRKCINDSEKFYDTDQKFHAVLYQVPGNPIYPALHRSFCRWLESHWRKMPNLPERNRRNYRAHKAIFTAILNRAPDDAEQLMRDHLKDAWTQVARTFTPRRSSKK